MLSREIFQKHVVVKEHCCMIMIFGFWGRTIVERWSQPTCLFLGCFFLLLAQPAAHSEDEGELTGLQGLTPIERVPERRKVRALL